MVKVLHIYPRNRQLQDIEGDSAFLGVSVGSPISTTPRLTEVLQWATDHFSPVRILIGDYLERHNILAENKLDSHSAAAAAMKKAAPVRENIKQSIQKLGQSPIEIISFYDLTLLPDFENVLRTLELHFKKDSDFRDVILTDVHNYAARRRKRGEWEDVRETQIERSIAYVLEELAVFALVFRAGSHVQLYPGQHLKVLSELSNQRLKCPVTELNRLVCVDLSL